MHSLQAFVISNWEKTISYSNEILQTLWVTSFHGNTLWLYFETSQKSLAEVDTFGNLLFCQISKHFLTMKSLLFAGCEWTQWTLYSLWHLKIVQNPYMSSFQLFYDIGRDFRELHQRAHGISNFFWYLSCGVDFPSKRMIFGFEIGLHYLITFHFLKCCSHQIYL